MPAVNVLHAYDVTGGDNCWQHASCGLAVFANRGRDAFITIPRCLFRHRCGEQSRSLITCDDPVGSEQLSAIQVGNQGSQSSGSPSGREVGIFT